MTYCIICQEVTNDYEEEHYWSKTYKLIMIHCELCRHFKHQYLKEIPSAD